MKVLTKNYEISIQIRHEAGYNQALEGLSYSYNKGIMEMIAVALRLKDKDNGENKFLEHIELWIRVTAPLRWWKQADTYRLSSKQSQSTMHTILSRKLSRLDFENGLIIKTDSFILNFLINCFVNIYIAFINLLIKYRLFDLVTIFLIDSYMQKRMWKMSYKTLRNIIIQRSNHKLPHWRKFCYSVLKQVQHPELLPVIKGMVE